MNLLRWNCVVVMGFCFAGCTSNSATTKRNVATKTPASAPTRAAKSENPRRQVNIRDVAFSSDNSHFAVLRRLDVGPQTSGNVEVWQGQTQQKLASWSSPVVPRAAVFVGENQLAMLTTQNFQIWNWKTRQMKTAPKILGNSVLTISEDQKLLATDLQIWRVADWKKIADIPSKWSDSIRAAAFSPNGMILVTGAWDVNRGIEAFDANSGKALWSANGDQQGNIVFSPNGRFVAVSTTGGIAVLRAKDGKLIRQIGNWYGGKIRFLSNRGLEQNSEKARLTFRVADGKLLKSQPIADLNSDYSSPDGSMRFRLVGAEKSVRFAN